MGGYHVRVPASPQARNRDGTKRLVECRLPCEAYIASLCGWGRQEGRFVREGGRGDGRCWMDGWEDGTMGLLWGEGWRWGRGNAIEGCVYGYLRCCWMYSTLRVVGEIVE